MIVVIENRQVAELIFTEINKRIYDEDVWDVRELDTLSYGDFPLIYDEEDVSEDEFEIMKELAPTPSKCLNFCNRDDLGQSDYLVLKNTTLPEIVLELCKEIEYDIDNESFNLSLMCDSAKYYMNVYRNSVDIIDGRLGTVLYQGRIICNLKGILTTYEDASSYTATQIIPAGTIIIIKDEEVR